MQNFRTLDLAIAFYHQSQALGLRGTLRDQLQRAALSIPLNLCEARGKPTRKDQLRFFHIAMGSVRESQGLLKIAGFESSECFGTLDRVGASLYRLIERAK